MSNITEMGYRDPVVTMAAVEGGTRLGMVTTTAGGLVTSNGGEG